MNKYYYKKLKTLTIYSIQFSDMLIFPFTIILLDNFIIGDIWLLNLN